MNLESSATVSDGHPRHRHLVLFGILLLTALAYAACLRYGFVYDDYPQIVNNGHLASWKFLPDYFTKHVWSQVSSSGTYYRPLFLVWLRLNRALFSVGSALPWHLTTILLHLLATSLLYFFLRRTLRDALTIAVATLVFALHPGHIESVAWISGCTEPLMACGIFGSLLCWVKRHETPGGRWYAASVLLFASALLVKETAILVPALIFVYALAFERSKVSRAALTIAPFACIAALELLVRHYALHGGVTDDIHTFRETAFTIPHALAFYAQHLVWPVGLSCFYNVFLAHSANILLIVISVVIVAVLVLLARLSREALVAVAWIALPLLPALAGIRVFDTTDVVHDRYLYLSTVGLGMLLGLAISRIGQTGGEIFGLPARPFAAILLIDLLLFTGTALELPYWQNNLTLFVRAVKIAPQSPPAFNHLAFEMYKRGDTRASHELYKKALGLDPQDWPATFGLAVLDMRTGDLAEADSFFQRAIELKPTVTNATYLLQAQVRLKAGRLGDAEQSARRAIELWPANLSQHLLLAQVLVAEKRPAEARQEFEKELELDPSSADAASGLQSLSK